MTKPISVHYVNPQDPVHETSCSKPAIKSTGDVTKVTCFHCLRALGLRTGGYSK